LYVPNERNRFCIEVKNYADSPLTDKVFTAQKTNNLIKWWRKICVQAENGGQKPLLFFKYNRSAVFVVTELKPEKRIDYMFISFLNCYILLADAWLENEEVEFTYGF
jgi:hypothetical protein